MRSSICGETKSQRRKKVKALRVEAKELSGLEKYRGFTLTDQERRVVEEARVASTRILRVTSFRDSFNKYLAETSLNFFESDGYRKKLEHSKKVMEGVEKLHFR